MKRRLLRKIGSDGVPFNTYIGGIYSQITTAAGLETRLGLSSGDVTDFENHTGNDIRCNINTTYTMPYRAFANISGSFPYNIVTHFVDLIGQCTTLADQQQFYNQTGCDFVFFPNIIGGIFGTQTFRLATNMTKCYLYGSYTDLGDTTGNNGVFGQITFANLTIYVPRYFETNNGGAPDGDISTYTALGMTCVYLDDDTIPAAVQTKLDAIVI